MNKLLFAGTIVAGLSSVAHSAQAQQASQTVQIPANGREQVKFHTSRPMVQILDTGPIVSDLRQRNVDQQYSIVVPPMPPSQTVVTPIYVPAVPGASGYGSVPSAGSPYAQIPNIRSLPQAGFQSNVPARGGMLPANQLPPGATTGVLGKLLTPVQAPVHAQARAPIAAPFDRSLYIAPAKYRNDYTGAGASSVTTRTTTSATGKLMRGDLLRASH